MLHPNPASATRCTIKHSLIRTTPLVAAALLASACSDRSQNAGPIAAPPAITRAASLDAASGSPNTSVHWNAVARSLVAARNTAQPLATRVYALVSVAQIEAVAAVERTNKSHRGGNSATSASVDAAIVRASADVLKGLYQDATSGATVDSALTIDASFSTEPSATNNGPAGDELGATVAHAVLGYANTDGAANANCPATPPLPATQFWHDDATPPNPQPLLPCFGNVRPWLPINVKVFRALPLPKFGSPAFLAGLAEVRQISDTRTADQLATINKWADGANTFTPPGRWNLIASDLITQNHINASRAAQIFAVLNIAEEDTHIACWDRKYAFWEIRPWMVDPLITTPVGKPHHPANPSGHACAGGAGSGALAGLFPAKRDSLFALGDEQAFTTVLSGVHYRFDVEAGTRIGRTIAAAAVGVNDVVEMLAQRK